MSGGRFDYMNDNLCNELFRWSVCPVYGMATDEEYKRSIKNAREINPLKDKVLSEMLYDMFCLLHSFDWAESGDTSEEVYREDVLYFKKKWLKALPDDIIKRQIEAGLGELREELYRDLVWQETVDAT